MSEDLNIRAARALKFRRYRDEEGFWRVPPKFQSALGNMMVIHPLKFTTSYDWSILGVKECIKRDLRDEIFQEMFELTATDDLTYLLDLTPSQITQAWVEVLEANS